MPKAARELSLAAFDIIASYCIINLPLILCLYIRQDINIP